MRRGDMVATWRRILAVIDIDRRAVAALQKDPIGGAIFYDRKLTGFGLRVSPKGRVSYFVEYRSGAGGRRTPKSRMVLGRDEPPAFRADHARVLAEQHLARVKLGQNPAAERSALRLAPTVGEVLNLYVNERVAPLRKPGTVALYRGYIRIHIRPVIGSKLAHCLTRADVTDLHRRIGRNHPVTANRAIVMLRAALDYAIRQGALAEGFHNPATAIDSYREQLRERYLSEDDFARLGATLALAGGEGLPWTPDPAKRVKHAPKAENRRVVIDPAAIAAVKLLLLTGARLREILHLRWNEVNLGQGVAVLPDSKTGRKVLIFGEAALSVIRSLPRSSAFVIAGQSRFNEAGEPVDGPRADLNRPWARIREHAGLDGVRLHDLRHSYASVGASAGLGLYVVGQLLGHRSPATTTRYAHVANRSLARASNAISGAISDALGLPTGAPKASPNVAATAKPRAKRRPTQAAKSLRGLIS